MQFQYNSDYPGAQVELLPDGSSGIRPTHCPARNPKVFPPAQPIPCAKITTRIYHPKRNQVATVQNVLVRTIAPPVRPSRPPGSARANAAAAAAGNATADADGSSLSSDDDDNMSSSSSSSSSSESMMMDDRPAGGGQQQAPQQQQQASGVVAGVTNLDDDEEDRAYWIQRTIREAIYGRVLLAVVLKRRLPHLRTGAPNDNAEWEVTEQHCAVKEMSWQHIRKERDRLAEDPIKEVSAMQYLKRYYKIRKKLQEQQLFQMQQQQQQQQQAALMNAAPLFHAVPPGFPMHGTAATAPKVDGLVQSFQAIMETNLMMPLDLLSDDRHLYSIMPFCDGGELFERLDMEERFSEEEARHWMFQVLNGLENLQNAGICHRDLSLENLLVHQSGALIIDLGMCLRIPFQKDDVPGLANSFGGLHVNGGIIQQPPPMSLAPQSTAVLGPMSLSSSSSALPLDVDIAGRGIPRYLIAPQGTCGKWIYMSPEIYKNKEPFDGFAVDMWAAGVILFLMLTGFPPWERACLTDERFKFMTQGYLVQMLTEWEIGISSDAMDLLQRMLWINPEDRLSLDQVRAHPWMVNGARMPPAGF